MKHLTSDIQNIKESFTRMHRYILGKSINSDKANEVKDLKGVSKMAWEFISAIYKLYWDNLFVDNSKTFFRNKVKSKFNLQVIRSQVSNKGKKAVKPTFISSIPPPIPAKSPIKVNKTLKYFKKSDKFPQKKFYTQAFSQSKLNKSNSLSSVTMDTLKIKETFPNLPNKKIDLV